MAESLVVSAGTVAPDEMNVQRRRIVISGLIGTSIEWFDFFLYGLIAPTIFNVLFFPKGMNPAVSTIAVLGVYAVGFASRPLGGLVFGHFGDRIGRKPMMYVTLTMMGIATALIGILPTYAAVGLLAPVLLTVLRFCQGFAIGGEAAGVAILSTESAPNGKRGFFTGIVQSGSGVGGLGATASAAAISWLPHDALMSWGWRLPFLASIVLVAIGLYVRMKIIESPVFARATEDRPPERVPLLALLRTEPKPALIVMLSAISESNMLNIFMIFGLVYVVQHLGVPRELMLTAMVYGGVLGIFSNIFFGFLSDSVGRKTLVLTSLILAALYVAFAYFQLLETKSVVLIIVAVSIPHVVLSPMIFSTEGSFYAELFQDARYRFTGVAVCKQVGTMIGGFFPLIAAALLAATGSVWGPVAYYCGVTVISVVAVSMARETYRAAI